MPNERLDRAFVFAFAAAGITGGEGVAEAEGDELLLGFGGGLGSGEPPQPLSTSPAANNPAASRGPSVRIRQLLAT